MIDVSPAPPDPVEIAEVYQDAADHPEANVAFVFTRRTPSTSGNW
jgi:hypothetical protein